jgi:ligand-binding sensor domain-containing protein
MKLGSVRSLIQPLFSSATVGRLTAAGYLIAALFGLLSFGISTKPAIAAARWDELAAVVFKNYGRQDGLPPLVPTALAQDGAGFLWIGTQGGIVRWDGYHFREYDASPAQTDGLPGTWIRALHADAAGRLWVGTDVNGLAFYDSDHDHFVPVALDPAQGGATRIAAIGDDGAGGLWIGTDNGLYQLAAGRASGPLAPHSKNDPKSLAGDKVSAVLLDRQKRLWVGTEAGLSRQDHGASGFEQVTLPSQPGDAIAVSALFEDRDSRIWIGTTQHGVYIIGPGERSAERLSEAEAGERPCDRDRRVGQP